MSRAVRPAKIDNDLYRNLARETDDGFGTFITNISVMVGTALAMGMTVGISAYFWLLALIPALLLMFTISFFKNTEPISQYDKTLYDKAYGHVSAIQDKESFEDAKELATNIWKHEQLMRNINKNHDNEWDCKNCFQRHSLIIDLKKNQPLPEIDGSDIERIEHKLAARKELGA